MIFIIGGTGFVGRTLIKKLLGAGEPVRALYRTEARCRSVQDPKLAWIQGEINDLDGLLHGMTGADTVIHLAGTLIEPLDQTFDKIHVAGTESVLAAARRSSIRRLLYMSALGARPDAASRYHRTKWAAEEAVRRSGLQATIFRPSLIFGREDVSLNRLSRIISCSPIVPVLGSGRTRLQPVWVEDVADAFLRSLDHKKTLEQTYSLCGPRAYTLDQLIDLIFRIRKSRRLKFHIPTEALKVPAAWAERFFTRPPLTRDQLIMLEEDNICSDNQAGRDLEIAFRTLEEILPGYLK